MKNALIFLLFCAASAQYLQEQGFGSNAEGCHECSAVFQTVEMKGEYKFMQSICNVNAVFVLERGCACAKAVKKFIYSIHYGWTLMQLRYYKVFGLLWELHNLLGEAVLV